MSTIDRRRFLRQTATAAAGLLAGCASRALQGPPVAVESASIEDLRRALEEGRETASSLVATCLRRIEDLDRNGPGLRSVIELNPDAPEIARTLDREAPRGPLHGIPVLIKDNIATHDRMATTAGSLALDGCIAPRDASVARKLRDAGAVILGKTNLSEWANFRSTRATSGWSGRGGLTRNPYALDRNPSGSSSGSAVAVAAGLCSVAVGTETNGSIVCPASVCGIVGIKPSVGLIAADGIIPISATQDTAGPMARTVADAAALLGVLAGRPLDLRGALDRDGLRGARIGVARNFFDPGSVSDDLLDRAVETLRRQGAVVLDPIDVPFPPGLGAAEGTLLSYEFKAGLNAYLAALGGNAPVKSLRDIIAFNEGHADRELLHFGQERFLQAEARGPLSDSAYRDALARCRRWAKEEGPDAILDRQGLDALVAPTSSPALKTRLGSGDGNFAGSSWPAAIAGTPNVTLPMGSWEGLPVGISFLGRAWSETLLIRLAYSFEQATLARRAPEFPPTVG
jgi:amidase